MTTLESNAPHRSVDVTRDPPPDEPKKASRTRPPLPPAFKELCDLCRTGKLFAVQEWFKTHKYTEPKHITSKNWPIGIAIDMRFHSLVEVLLQNGVPADADALEAALWERNEDMVTLLLRYGADVRSVPFEEVVDAACPSLIRLFVERGADLITGYPIAKGLVQTTRPLLGIYKTYIEKYPQLQFQADMALRHFCEEGNLRGVSLLMWLGANPRAVATRLGNSSRALLPTAEGKEREQVSGVQELLEVAAVFGGNFDGVQAQDKRASMAQDARFKLERLAVCYGADVTVPAR